MIRSRLTRATRQIPRLLFPRASRSRRNLRNADAAFRAFTQFKKTPEARQLLKLIEDDHDGDRKAARAEMAKLLSMFRRMRHDAVIEGIQRSINEGSGRIAFIRRQVIDVENELTPRYNFCTAGRTAIEINADGQYTRCTKYNALNMYSGSVFDSDGIRLINLDSEADCNILCKKRMCIASNIIRGATREEFDQEIEDKGLIGNYRRVRNESESEIFIRWKLTNTCNYTCSYCSAWKTVNRKLPELDRERLIDVAQQFINQFDRISLRLTGGEPSIKKNYVELMTFINRHLENFVDIDIRTNFSYKEKQLAIFDLDWQGKLYYHIACHVYDRNFKPWEFVEILKQPHNVKYTLKFVSTPSNEKYVDKFRQYFIDNGIPEDAIRVIHDVRASAEDAEKIPPAYTYLFGQQVTFNESPTTTA